MKSKKLYYSSPLTFFSLKEVFPPLLTGVTPRPPENERDCW